MLEDDTLSDCKLSLTLWRIISMLNALLMLQFSCQCLILQQGGHHLSLQEINWQYAAVKQLPFASERDGKGLHHSFKTDTKKLLTKRVAVI